MSEHDLPTPEQVEDVVHTGMRFVDTFLRLYQRITAWLPGSQAPAPSEPGSDEPEPKEPSGILIIGPGGTGKSTLARLLSGIGPPSPLESLGNYVESNEVEEYPVNDGPPAEIVVPPGQLRHRPRDWPAVYTAITAGKYRGVILVVSFGYHSFGISYKQHRLYAELKSRKTVPAFVQRYCEEQRKDELAVLEGLEPHLKLSPGKLWFLTVVTKQDLWCGQQAEVEKYYAEGKYGGILKKVRGHRGDQTFRSDVVLTSLVIRNFKTTQDEELQKNAAGYDHACQVESLRRLFLNLDTFREWEAK
jgi:energy-coupling factor transporter ATP-binding protein EcfA2